MQSKKARLKLWNTSSEKVCEVQTVDEAGTSSSTVRYTNRRYSDFVPTALPPVPSNINRRASENPSMLSPCPTPSKKGGIVCSNTDLISLLTSLASSATEINRIDEAKTPTMQPQTPPNKSNNSFLKVERKASLKKSNRSNSFDVSIFKQVAMGTTKEDPKAAEANVQSNWFTKRHQPMAKRGSTARASKATVTFAKEAFEKLTSDSSSKEPPPKDTKPKKKEHKSPLSRLKWDGRSAIVDARMIGSAIEGFLKRDGSSSSSSKNAAKQNSRCKKTTKTSWFGGKTEEEDSSGDTCDSSLCSTLKDLFVK